MAISRMQQPRQLYGLGKLVKSATRGIKKIIKSPLGKAALLAGGAYLTGGALTGKGIRGGLSNFSVYKNLFNKGRFLSPLIRDKEGTLNLGRAALSGLGATAIATPFLMGDDDDGGGDDAGIDISSGIRQQAKDYYKNPIGSSLAFMPNKSYVMPNYYLASGGRVNFQMGGGAGEQQAEQLLMMEYVKYKNKGGELSFQEFVQAVMEAQAEQQAMDQDMQQTMDPGMEQSMYAGMQQPMDPGMEQSMYAGMEQPMDQDMQQPMYAGMEQPMDMSVGAAHGGRIGYKGGGMDRMISNEQDELDMYKTYLQIIGEKEYDKTIKEELERLKRDYINQKFGVAVAHGGRIGYQNAGMVNDNTGIMQMASIPDMNDERNSESLRLFNKPIYELSPEELDLLEEFLQNAMPAVGAAYGGRIGYSVGGLGAFGKRKPKAEGGLMNLGGMEKDYRAEGGFVAIGGKEKADDVPARLSRNEFVFTADAVRNAGGGNIDKGAEVMENMMNHLEQGGRISEESQGLKGAQKMYDQQQMLKSRMI